MNITGLWDQLVDCICRPPRDEYAVSDLPGGTAASFKLKGKEYLRKDAQLVNKQGLKLKCSHLVPKYPPQTKDGKLPCVVYCHCNSGSRRDSEEALHLLLPQNITVFALDFAGSGQSDGKYVTLGYREQDDLALAIQHLRKTGNVSTIGLWGRSMGAVTALLYSQTDPSIAGIVVDSPFSKLTELMMELVEEQKIPIPRSLMRVALSMMRRSVKKRAGFSIDEVAPIEQVQKAFIPCLFGHARADTFVAKGHSERLLAKYGGEDKELCLFEGDHNSIRPTFFYTKVLMFFHVVLQCESVLIPDETCPGQFELASDEAARAVDELEPLQLPLRTLPRTRSPVWTDLPTFDGSPEDMQDYLSDPHLTRGNSLPDPRAQDRGTPRPRRETADARHQASRPDRVIEEEAALAQALELSLREVQQQEHGHIAGGGRQAAAAASTALQETIPEDMQRMAPEDAEEAMLAAAIRASLIEADQHQASSSAQDSKPHHSSGEQHASSSPDGGVSRHRSSHHRQTDSPASTDNSHHRADNQQPSTSGQAAGTQQPDRHSRQESEAALQHQSSSGNSHKPPRQHLPVSRSTSALHSLEQQQPSASIVSSQQATPNGYRGAPSPQQQAQRDQLASDLRKLSSQAGANQASLPDRTSAQGVSDDSHGQHALHQSQSQPSLLDRDSLSSPSQSPQQQPGEHHNAQQPSPVQQEHGNQKQRHGSKSALQLSDRLFEAHMVQQGATVQQQGSTDYMPQQGHQAAGTVLPVLTKQPASSAEGDKDFNVDDTVERSSQLVDAGMHNKATDTRMQNDTLNDDKQHQAKATDCGARLLYPDTQLCQFADIELAHH